MTIIDRDPTYADDKMPDGSYLVEDFDIRSGRTFDRAARECDTLDRLFPRSAHELRFAWGFSYGRPGTPPGIVPQIQVWARDRS